jgi:hypothetical protein
MDGHHAGRVPGVEDATPDKRRFVNYLLDPEHEGGRGKAKFFAQHGWTQSNWDSLATAIHSGVLYVEARETETNQWGVSYEALVPVTTPTGTTVTIATGWFVDDRKQETRLITAYPPKSTRRSKSE